MKKLILLLLCIACMSWTYKGLPIPPIERLFESANSDEMKSVMKSSGSWTFLLFDDLGTLETPEYLYGWEYRIDERDITLSVFTEGDPYKIIQISFRGLNYDEIDIYLDYLKSVKGYKLFEFISNEYRDSESYDLYTKYLIFDQPYYIYVGQHSYYNNDGKIKRFRYIDFIPHEDE